jgi:hypothetical protein
MKKDIIFHIYFIIVIICIIFTLCIISLLVMQTCHKVIDERIKEKLIEYELIDEKDFLY